MELKNGTPVLVTYSPFLGLLGSAVNILAEVFCVDEKNGTYRLRPYEAWNFPSNLTYTDIPFGSTGVKLTILSDTSAQKAKDTLRDKRALEYRRICIKKIQLEARYGFKSVEMVSREEKTAARNID